MWVKVGAIFTIIGVLALIWFNVWNQCGPSPPPPPEEVGPIVTFPEYDRYVVVGQDGKVRIKWEHMFPEACKLRISLINPSYGFHFDSPPVDHIEVSCTLWLIVAA